MSLDPQDNSKNISAKVYTPYPKERYLLQSVLEEDDDDIFLDCEEKADEELYYDPIEDLAPIVPIPKARLEGHFRSQTLCVLDPKLDAIKEKVKALENRGCQRAAATASLLLQNLMAIRQSYLDSNCSLETFKDAARKHIQEALPELEKHRGWKHILGNLLLCILGLGVGYAVAGIIKKGITGKFLFFTDTDSKALLSKTDKLLENIKDDFAENPLRS